ncbi:hypothetical protein Tco_0267164 [Tanacetum coccineum]
MALHKRSFTSFHSISDAKEMWMPFKLVLVIMLEIGYKGRDQRTGKQEQPKALLTIDAGVIDWSGQAEEEEDYALMEIQLKQFQEQLGDASIEIQAYTQALKKVEAQLVAHQQSQLWLTIPEQTATGKGKSNPFMAGSLPKLQSQLSWIVVEKMLLLKTCCRRIAKDGKRIINSKVEI